MIQFTMLKAPGVCPVEEYCKFDIPNENIYKLVDIQNGVRQFFRDIVEFGIETTSEALFRHAC